MSVFTLQSGRGGGETLQVSSAGSARADLDRFLPKSPYLTPSTSVGSTSTMVVDSRDGRQVLKVKNTGTNPAFVAFGTSATTSDWPLSPGEVLEVRAVEDALYAITAGGVTTTLVVLETA